MKKYTVTSPESACDDPQEYDQFFEKDGVRIYSKEDLMITYIPYEALGIEQGEKFGFACNLYYHYTGGE
ncbi:MAG: hypothetical protein MJ200_04335 [Mycoplasmoidaceae bacterium]|nr:hypothetical protein [Mycoplasmoidaceae bacterium]